MHAYVLQESVPLMCVNAVFVVPFFAKGRRHLLMHKQRCQKVLEDVQWQHPQHMQQMQQQVQECIILVNEANIALGMAVTKGWEYKMDVCIDGQADGYIDGSH
jgi:hypothetical protein